MKLKLDENLGKKPAEVLREAGHEVSTVADQGLQASSDKRLIEACSKEDRCMVSLDLDFANPLVFKPSEHAGIAVLRLPKKATPQHLLETVRTLADGLARDDITGKLWVVQPNRIRLHQEE